MIIARFFYKYSLAYDLLNHIVHFPDTKKKRLSKINVESGNDLILELACGTGLSSRIFYGKNVNVIHLDINENFVAYGKKKGRIGNAVVGSAYQLCFSDTSFDKIIFHDAFHHVLEHELLFKECSRILKPSGEFIILDVVAEKTASNEIINHFVDGIIWELDQEAFQRKILELAHNYNFNMFGFCVTKKEPTLMGLLGGIDVIATLVKT